MRFYLLFFYFLLAPALYASTFTIKDNAPKRYVVQPGDSLWSIAHHYLKNPWEWKKLWHANPAIKNPKRLYPGAVLILENYPNNPYIKVIAHGTVKLSPHSRITSVDNAVPAIALEDIKPFLNQSLVLDKDMLHLAPYVIAFVGEHMLGGQGVEVYVRGLHPDKQLPIGGTLAYSFFREGKKLLDPNCNEVLGYKATLVGYGELTAGGEPATVLLTNINSGIRIEDKVLINNTPEFDLYFEPSTPVLPVSGFIIDMPDGMPVGNSQSAVGGVVIINMGINKGLKPGNVLGIFKQGNLVPDPKNPSIAIQLPAERIGEAMIFRTFTKTSFALIVRSIRPIYLNDIVSNP